jgi:MFS family permease
MAAETRAKRFSPDEARIVHFTGFAHGATHYVELVYPTLAVGLAAETGLPLERVLSWSFVGYLFFGLGALPAGIAADRYGARRVILFGLLVAGASACAAGLAEPGWPLALCLAGLGAGASLYHPAGTGLLSRAVTARGRALGINGIYGNLGIALAPLTTATLVAATSWRATFVLTGAAIILATLAFSRMHLAEPPIRHESGDVKGDEQPGVSPRAVAAFVILCVTATLGGFSYRGNTVAQPALFAEEISFMGYGMAATLAMLVGIAGQYLGGTIADRRDLRTSYLFFHLCSLPMLVLISRTTELPLLLASSLYVFFALGMQPIENSLFATLTPERWRSTAYGLKFVLTFGVGSTAVWMVRGVAGRSGWAAVYLVLAGVCAALIAGIVLLIVVSRRDRGGRERIRPEELPGAQATGPSQSPAVGG